MKQSMPKSVMKDAKLFCKEILNVDDLLLSNGMSKEDAIELSLIHI